MVSSARGGRQRVRRVGPAKWLALALLVAPAAWGQAGAQAPSAVPASPDAARGEAIFETPDAPPTRMQSTIPDYPPEAAWRGITGTTVMVVTVAETGAVGDVRIESSSGSEALDAAAVASVREWQFAPARRGDRSIPARVRVPVAFEIQPQYRLDRTTGRPRDAYFARRRAGTMPEPGRDAEGRFPGFVEDPYPIGVASLEAGERLLARYAFREPDAVPGKVREYTLRDEEGMSVWNVAAAAGELPPALVRRRLVGDGDASWYVSSLLCDGTAERCATLRAFLRDTVPPQRPGPALPALPPLREPR